MASRVLVLFGVALVCAGCSALPAPCRSEGAATGTGSGVSEAEARVTWQSGGCPGR